MSQTLCMHCKIRPASIFYQQYADGKESAVQLCAKCAQKLGVGEGGSLLWDEDLFGIPLFSQLFSASKIRPDLVSCPLCGTTEEEIRSKGVFGCSECYENFSSRMDLTPFIGKGYRGKRLGEATEEKKENAPLQEKTLANLKRALKEAVEKEDYEQAALLRDQIREREGK